MKREFWLRVHFQFRYAKNVCIFVTFMARPQYALISNYAKQCMRKDFGCTCNIILALFERHALTKNECKKKTPLRKYIFGNHFRNLLIENWNQLIHLIADKWKKKQLHVPLIIHLVPFGTIFCTPNCNPLRIAQQPNVWFSTTSPSDFINSICLRRAHICIGFVWEFYCFIAL